MTLEFFMLMIPPTVTHQEKKVSVVEKNGKAIPKVYEPEDLKAARAKLLTTWPGTDRSESWRAACS